MTECENLFKSLIQYYFKKVYTAIIIILGKL